MWISHTNILVLYKNNFFCHSNSYYNNYYVSHNYTVCDDQSQRSESLIRESSPFLLVPPHLASYSRHQQRMSGWCPWMSLWNYLVQYFHSAHFLWIWFDFSFCYNCKNKYLKMNWQLMTLIIRVRERAARDGVCVCESWCLKEVTSDLWLIDLPTLQ